MTTLTHTVDKQFSFRIIGIDVNRNLFTFPTFKIPMGENMQGMVFLVPKASIKVKAVFRKTGQVKYSKYRAM